ncbi:histone-lysine N-methyltransferase ASHR2-like [Arachis stenosperma]|uniref:histone-lysine N-methyltransferase ASHR2-like n=1 Tax=Arachis stenosperma TaxID=217475 RepID=UPI0025AC1327|nr:histone-lysine N-methyltransferase ASHR2-like [Arachis stenosperma]
MVDYNCDAFVLDTMAAWFYNWAKNEILVEVQYAYKLSALIFGNMRENVIDMIDGIESYTAQFFIAAYNLANISPSDFQILLFLHGSPDDATISAAQFLHPLISSFCSIAPTGLQNVLFLFLELTSALLAKDKHNVFGLMQPVSVDDGERSIRIYGIYPYASFFNHDCLPNICRFDYVDSNPLDGSNNTDIIVRMIHDVPQDREICLSYFSINENYASRKKKIDKRLWLHL